MQSDPGQAICGPSRIGRNQAAAKRVNAVVTDAKWGRWDEHQLIKDLSDVRLAEDLDSDVDWHFHPRSAGNHGAE